MTTPIQKRQFTQVVCQAPTYYEIVPSDDVFLQKLAHAHPFRSSEYGVPVIRRMISTEELMRFRVFEDTPWFTSKTMKGKISKKSYSHPFINIQDQQTARENSFFTSDVYLTRPTDKKEILLLRHDFPGVNELIESIDYRNLEGLELDQETYDSFLSNEEYKPMIIDSEVVDCSRKRNTMSLLPSGSTGYTDLTLFKDILLFLTNNNSELVDDYMGLLDNIYAGSDELSHQERQGMGETLGMGRLPYRSEDPFQIHLPTTNSSISYFGLGEMSTSRLEGGLKYHQINTPLVSAQTIGVINDPRVEGLDETIMNHIRGDALNPAGW